ncbi:MAG: hypothetical protein R3D29_15480 [Nitratireductor sp.]
MSSPIWATALIFIWGSWRSASRSASGANITYKLLYNDAVAMTGGQKLDGTPTVPQLSEQLAAEGVKEIWLVSDEPCTDKYSTYGDLASGVQIRHRDYLEDVQKHLREVQGCTAIIYDQTCAAEKRRRRSAGTMIDLLTSAPSSIRWSVKAAAIARSSRTAFPSSRWRPNSVASARSTSRPATRTFPV